MAGHISDIRKANTSNAMFVHMQDHPGHSFDIKGAKLIYTSNQKSNRQLVESSLIATIANCNLKPGDRPVCRIAAPVVLNSVKLNNCSNSITPQLTVTPITSTDLPDNLPLAIPTPPALAPALLAPQPVASHLTQTLQNLAISSPIQPHIVSNTSHNPAPPTTSFTPIARHTRSHYQLLDLTPHPAQSQARALQFTPATTSPAPSHIDSPPVRKTLSHAPLSQCHSPPATTGAIRKRRFVNIQSSSSDIFSPMAKRLRSSQLPH